MHKWTTTIIICVAGVLATASGRAQTFTDDLGVRAEVPDPTAEGVDFPLYLDVSVNGRKLGLIAEFQSHMSVNRLSATRQELNEIGIRPPRNTNRRVFLDTIPGLRYRYDEAAQSIQFLAPNSALLPRVQSAQYQTEPEEPEKTWGAVLNYSLSSDFSDARSGKLKYNSSGASLKGWIFSPYATLGSTAFYSHSGARGNGELIRQDTALEFNSMKRALTLTVGDFNTSSLSWSRPIRMGGIQVRRDFSLRNDIVTEQRLSYSGAAAVPSTVDVFIANNRAYSTEVDSGPFRIEDIPFYSGSGDAIVVVRDETGRLKAEEVSFFAGHTLLKKGIADYSIEIGRAREAYGLRSNEYGEDTAVSGSFRYGLTERITLQTHIEAKSDLHLYGLGFSMVPFNLGELSVAAGNSEYNGNSSGFVQGSFRTAVRGVDVNMSVMRTEPGYADLAFATGVDYLGQDAIASNGSLLEFPTALEVLTLSIPVTRDQRKMGISLVHADRANSDDTIAAVSFGTSIGGSRASVSVFASHNLTTEESRMAVNLSMPLDNRRHLRGSVGRGKDGDISRSINLSRPMGEMVGDYGYNLQLENQDGIGYASGRGEYRSRYGKGVVEVARSDQTTSLRTQIEGAIVLAQGATAIGNTVNDSFAIVDVGVADVPIYNQNREVTVSNSSGKALVTGLSSYRSNRISVNVADLPPEASLNATAMDVIPARRSGNLVDLGGQSEASVLVILRDATGAVIPAGSAGYLNGAREEFYVGYDGQAWLEGVKQTNKLRVELPGGECTASFEFSDESLLQDFIDPVECL